MMIAAHCLVKNEENFIWYAVKSVIDFVDQIIIFDTGSEDKTVEIIKKLITEYPQKIIFEEKGPADKVRHTELRNEMIQKTNTDWFMVLDGDEVWSGNAIKEAIEEIRKNKFECLVAPFYLCVGDIFHYSARGAYNIRGNIIHATPRFFRRNAGIYWQGSYDNDFLADVSGKPIFEKNDVGFISGKFWHVSHLRRSSVDDETYSSGINRKRKRRLTYFIIGRKIKENVPEIFIKKSIFEIKGLSRFKSFINFFHLVVDKFFI
jgi:glycosyltransferase involved in cell wall biosynthesis